MLSLLPGIDCDCGSISESFGGFGATSTASCIDPGVWDDHPDSDQNISALGGGAVLFLSPSFLPKMKLPRWLP